MITLTKDSQKQCTISKELYYEGQSLFSTQKISMTLRPAPVNSGVSFIVQGCKISATADYLKPTDLHTTTLSKDSIDITMVEHLLATIYGLGIDNVDIITDSNVVPTQDGSSESFTKALKKVNVVEQSEFRTVLEVKESINFEQPEFEGRKAVLSPNKEGFILSVFAPFPSPIGTYSASFNGTPENFEANISWARTFLRSPLNLADLSKWNGIRTVFKALPEDPRKSPVITFTEQEFLTPLKCEEEPATHKLLDTIGDLALVGYRIRGSLSVELPGHKFTHQIAKELRDMIKASTL